MQEVVGVVIVDLLIEFWVERWIVKFALEAVMVQT